MNKKKIISAMLTVAMLASSAVSALAAEVGESLKVGDYTFRKRVISMKKVLISLLLSSVFATTTVNALENIVQPEVTDLGISNPKTGLIVGNSYSFYNCGVLSYLRGLTREAKQPWKARILTMSSAMLSYHNVNDYLPQNKEIDPYAKRKHKFSVVFVH